MIFLALRRPRFGNILRSSDDLAVQGKRAMAANEQRELA
jgi:hypothetical protein